LAHQDRLVSLASRPAPFAEILAFMVFFKLGGNDPCAGAANGLQIVASHSPAASLAGRQRASRVILSAIVDASIIATMGVNDDAFQSLINCIERIVPAIAVEPGLAEYLTEQAIGKAGILRVECQRLERLEREHLAGDIAMGASTRMPLGYAVALTRLELAAKSAVAKGCITEELRSAVQALEETAHPGEADA
jgi:hypothetical protein